MAVAFGIGTQQGRTNIEGHYEIIKTTNVVTVGQAHNKQKTENIENRTWKCSHTGTKAANLPKTTNPFGKNCMICKNHPTMAHFFLKWKAQTQTPPPRHI